MRQLLLLAVAFALLCLVYSHSDSPDRPGPVVKPKPKPENPGGSSCPAPTPETLKCIREWACQHVIRLDLRCLLQIPGILNGGLGRGGTGLLPGLLGG